MKIKTIKSTPELLLELRDDTQTIDLGHLAYPNTPKAAFAFSFGYKFRAVAKGMSLYEREWCIAGIEAAQIAFTP